MRGENVFRLRKVINFFIFISLLVITSLSNSVTIPGPGGANITYINVFGNPSASTSLTTTGVPSPWSYLVNLSTMEIYFKDKPNGSNAIQFNILNNGSSRNVNYQIQGANASLGIISANTITYPGIFSGINITYIVSNFELAKLITIQDQGSVQNITFKFQFSGVDYRTNPDGSITFNDSTTNEDVFTIAAPLGWDSNQSVDETGRTVNTTVKTYYNVRQTGPNFFIDLIINETDLSKFVYPIYIDPTTQSACGTISLPGLYELNQSVSTTTSCFTITTNNVDFHCASYNVTGDKGASDLGFRVTTSANNVTIRNCNVTSFGAGIDFTNISNGSFYNNRLWNHASVGMILRGIRSVNNNLTNITAYNNTTDGLGFHTNVSNNTIYNNLLFNNTRYGVFVSSDTNYNNFTNNTVYLNTNAGFNFQINSYNNLVSNNTIYLNKEEGIEIHRNSSNNVFVNNTIYNNTKYGIHVFLTDANHNNFTNNTVYNNYQYGFNITDGVCCNVLTGNSVFNNTFSGIVVSNRSNNNTLTNNSVYNNSQSGIILFYVINASLTNNSVFNNTFDGIYVNDGTNDSAITNNIIYKNGFSGIVFSNNSLNLVVENNTVYNNSVYGFHTFSLSNITFFNNTANNNTNHGFIFVNASRNSIKNNTAYNNTPTGFYFANQSNNNSVANNTAANHSQYGFFFQNEINNTVSSNTAQNNTVYGFHASNSTNISLISNQAFTNFAGIVLNVSNGIFNISTNVVGNNSYYGFYLLSVFNSTFSSNNATNNTLVGYHLVSGSNLTFDANNFAFSTPQSALDINITGSSNVTTLFGSNYYNLSTSYGSIYFTNATNVSIKLMNLSDSGATISGCSGFIGSCTLITVNTNVVNITNNSGSAVIDLGMFYDIANVGSASPGDIYTSKYNLSDVGWRQVGVTVIDTALGSIRYDNLFNFSTFGVAKYQILSSPPDTSDSSPVRQAIESSRLYISYEISFLDNTLEIIVNDGDDSVRSAFVSIYKGEEKFLSGLTDSDGKLKFDLDLFTPSNYILKAYKSSYTSPDDILINEDEFLREFLVSVERIENDFIITVMDEHSRPVEGATIQLNQLYGVSDSLGILNFTDLDSGHYDLTITKTGYKDAKKSYIFSADDKTVVEEPVGQPLETPTKPTAPSDSRPPPVVPFSCKSNSDCSEDRICYQGSCQSYNGCEYVIDVPKSTSIGETTIVTVTKCGLPVEGIEIEVVTPLNEIIIYKTNKAGKAEIPISLAGSYILKIPNAASPVTIDSSADKNVSKSPQINDYIAPPDEKSYPFCASICGAIILFILFFYFRSKSKKSSKHF